MSNILQRDGITMELRRQYENAKIQTEDDFKEVLKYVLSGCKKY